MAEEQNKNKFAKWLDDRENTCSLRIKGEVEEGTIGDIDRYDNCIIGLSTNLQLIYSLEKLVNYMDLIGFSTHTSISHLANQLLYLKKVHDCVSPKEECLFPIIMRDMNLNISDVLMPGYHGHLDGDFLALFHVE